MAVFQTVLHLKEGCDKGILYPLTFFSYVRRLYSALLNKAERDGLITGVKVCHRAPSVSHLLLADDSLILIRANQENAAHLQSILQLYESVSGQTINKEKSAILFSTNTRDCRRAEVKLAIQISKETMNDRYLGLLVHVGVSRSATFKYLKDRICHKIQGWKEKMLSRAGKEILIKAVAQAIPTFAMGCFDLTKTLCDQISSMICKFWWSQQDNEHKMHWLSWEKLTKTKSEGGLGFRDIHGFNMAMLAKQGWRLLMNPESLCAQILRAKYYPDGDVLKAKNRSAMSYSCRSILSGIDLLKNGVIWRVGDGSKISIWEDAWLPRDHLRRLFTPRGANLLTRVDELIDPYTGSWDEMLVRDTFWEDDADIILSIPVHEGMNDLIAWHYNQNGLFTVKSAYKIYMAEKRRTNNSAGSSSTESGGSSADRCWSRLWKVKCPFFGGLGITAWLSESI